MSDLWNLLVWFLVSCLAMNKKRNQARTIREGLETYVCTPPDCLFLKRWLFDANSIALPSSWEKEVRQRLSGWFRLTTSSLHHSQSTHPTIRDTLHPRDSASAMRCPQSIIKRGDEGWCASFWEAFQRKCGSVASYLGGKMLECGWFEIFLKIIACGQTNKW